MAANRFLPSCRRALWYVLLILLAVGWVAPLSVGAQEDDAAAPAGARAEPTAEDTAPVTPDTDADAGDADAAPAAGPAAASVRSALPGGADVAIIRIEDMIYGFTLDSLERRVDRALNNGASLIVIELHTPGGLLDAAVDISKYIKTLPVPTVAWVNRDAYSAGALIASAADEIVMARAGAIGAATPITQSGDIPDGARGKIFGMLLEDFRDNAAENGYDYALLHAMVVPEIRLYHIEGPEGERHVVNELDYRVLVRGETTDEAEQALAGAGNDMARPSPYLADDEQAGQWTLLEQFHDGQTALTMSRDRALNVGFASAGINNESELRQYLRASSVTRIDQTWSERFAGFLTHPMVRGILMLALILGAYIEFQTPGIGIGGAVAAVALIALLGAPFIVGLAEIWHVLLFLLGFVLLMLELFFFAGFGVLGIAGVVLMFAGLVLTAVPTGGGAGFGPVQLPPEEVWRRTLTSSLYLMAGVFLSFIGIYFLAKNFSSVPLFNRLVLSDAQLAGAGASGIAGSGPAPAMAGGATATAPAPPAPPAAPVSGDEALGDGRVQIGRDGVVTTGLRPAGRAEFDGEVVDVVSTGQWIDRGQRVRVIEVHGNRIVVETADE
ncbi:MAG: NfeD family protein [Phycisphaeraceae bacterium]